MDKKDAASGFEKTKDQMEKVLTNPVLCTFLRGIYYLNGFCGRGDIEGIYAEGKKYTSKEVGLEELRGAVRFFKDNNLIEVYSKANAPEEFQINDEGKELFYKVFDMEEFLSGQRND